MLIGLAEDFLVDYIQVNIGSLQLNANHNIHQIIEVCQDYEKENRYAVALVGVAHCRLSRAT